MTIAASATAAVETVAAKFRDNQVPIEEIPGGFAHESGFGPTTVRAIAASDDARRSGVTGVIAIETELPETASELTDDELALVNRMCILSATVRRRDGSMVATSRVSVWEGHESELDLQRHLIFGAALIQGEELVRAVRYLFDEEKDFDQLPAGDESGGWHADEFTRAARSLYCTTTHAPDGMTAELPWDDAAKATNGTQRHSLLRMSVAEHPACGNGLHVSLDLPLQFDAEELGSICNALNLAEYESHATPPLFGAWCAGTSERHPAFNGFIPNLLYRPFLVDKIANWLVQRSDWAQAWFEKR